MGGQKGKGGEGIRGAGSAGSLGLTSKYHVDKYHGLISRYHDDECFWSSHFTCCQLVAWFPLLIVVVG